MRIKHAYNTLINSESRFNNATSTRANYSTPYDKKSTAQEEQFYGFGMCLLFSVFFFPGKMVCELVK